MMSGNNIFRFLKGGKGVALIPLLCCIFFIIPIALFSGEKLKHIATVYGDKISKPFNQPSSLFFDESKQRFYIADTRNNRLVSFDSAYSYISEFSAGKSMKLPISIVKDNKGRLIITEGQKNQVTIINIKKKSLNPLDLSKVPKNHSIIFGNLAIDKKDNLYVIDRFNKRILVFNNKDKYIREITVKKGLAGFNDVKVDIHGNLYAIDALKGRIYIFNQKGKSIAKFGKLGQSEGDFGFPISLAVDKRGLIYVLDRHKNRIFVYNKEGDFLEGHLQLGWQKEGLYYPTYIFINQSQLIFIVDRDNNRIQVYKR